MLFKFVEALLSRLEEVDTESMTNLELREFIADFLRTYNAQS